MGKDSECVHWGLYIMATVRLVQMEYQCMEHAYTNLSAV